MSRPKGPNLIVLRLRSAMNRLLVPSDKGRRYSLTEGAAGIFGGDDGKRGDDADLVAQLYQQIGQLKVERDFLENALGP